MDTYEASFKKPHCGKLLWVMGEYRNEVEATKGLKAFFESRHSNQGYILYGGPLKITQNKL